MADERPVRNRLIGINVPRGERIASAVVGAALIGLGVRARSLAGALGVALGAALFALGASGRCPVFRARASKKGIEVRRAVTIQSDPHTLYLLWRDPRQLQLFMSHVDSVELCADNISQWTVREGPLELSWRAELVEDVPDRRLRWKSLPGGDLDHEGTIDLRPADGDRGTIVDVRIRYRPPGGAIVAGAFGGLLRELPGTQLEQELARMRMLVETGEIATSARRPADVDAQFKPGASP